MNGTAPRERRLGGWVRHGVPIALALGACAGLLWLAAPGEPAKKTRRTRGPLEVSPLALELEGEGENIDDACFWTDAENPARSLVFVTAKGSGSVEVFDLPSGARVGAITGFRRPNNCAVEGDLLLTTDSAAPDVKVHHLPDLTPVDAFGAEMGSPEGIDVLTTPEGAHLAYVTDSADASVHVYELATMRPVRSFRTGFGAGIEPILADDRHQRIYVARGEKEEQQSIGVFTPDGTLLHEFGAGFFGSDVEGMAIYACLDGGYLVAADQSRRGTQFEVFDRETLVHVATFRLQDAGGERTDSTDGIDILQVPLPGLASGILAACDGCGDSKPEGLDVVDWERVAARVGLDRCPGGGEPDCRSGSCTRRFAAVADAVISNEAPLTNFGSTASLEVERHPPEITAALLRFEIGELTGFDVLGAHVRLTADDQRSAGTDGGGRLFRSRGSWSESEVTFASKPVAIGGPLASAGAVARAQPVDFDVSTAVKGTGTYDFLLLPSSKDRARYRSREAGKNPPTLLLTLRASSPPVITLAPPAEAPAAGTPLTLAATASDPENGDLSARIVWQSDRDGTLGRGASLTAARLTAGAHTITARVEDDAGLSASASLPVVVHSRADRAASDAAGATTGPGAPSKSSAATDVYGRAPTRQRAL